MRWYSNLLIVGTIGTAMSFGVTRAGDLQEAVARAAEISSVEISATGQRFEPQQTVSPGAPPRHVSNYSLTVRWVPAESYINESWHLDTVYPFPNSFEFNAEYFSDGGHRTGRDGFRPNTDGPVSAARVGAVTKDMWLSNPLILMSSAEKSDIDLIQNNAGDAVTFNAHGTQWSITLDPETGLPTSLATVEKDHLKGSVVNRVDYSDWRMIDGIPFPFKLEQVVDGRLIEREVRHTVSLDALKEPVSGKVGSADNGNENFDQSEFKRGWSTSHFYLRRAMLGAPSDGNEAVNVAINDLGNGIFQITGSSHHTIVVEGRRGLAVVDAAWYPRRSSAVLAAMKKKWGRKPIRYVILTHHHIDHSGGLRPFAELGATVVTSAENYKFFHDILVETDATPPSMQVVDKRLKLSGLGRSIEFFDIPNSHANDMIGVYVPDAKMAINTDLYSPGRPAQQPVWAREFHDAILFHGLDVESHVGAHGNGIEPHQNLVDLVTK